MSNPPVEAKAALGAKGIVGWVVGAAIGSYSGINLLIPLVATGAMWWAGSKLFREEKKLILPAFSINAGHFLWLTLAFALMGAGALSTVGGDLLVYVIALTWLLIKPSLGPLYLLGIFQLVSLGINGYSLAEAAIGSAANKALLVHFIWRAMALFFTFKLFVTLRNAPKADAAIAP